MITLRSTVAAFLRNGEKYLLMKRADGRSFLPGVWSGVGGHIEPCEMNDPCAACYREIEEETGITRSDIISLDLLYIITRRSGSEIRQSYVYFGETSRTDVTQTGEGELNWVPEKDLLALTYSLTFTTMLEHYTQREPNDHTLYVGIAGNDGGKLKMSWVKCEDFERDGADEAAAHITKRGSDGLC